MAVTINADTTNGLVMTPDTSGQIKLQAGGADIATVSSTGIAMASGKGLAATGHVLQVIYGESSSVTSWASGATWKDFGVSATITPSATSSKILVIVDVNYGFSVVGIAHSARLLRDSTLIYGGANASYIQGFQATEGSISGRQYETHKLTASTLDSPSSTSALTYKVQHYQHTTGATVYLNRTDSNQTGVHAQTRSSIILMEIAG